MWQNCEINIDNYHSGRGKLWSICWGKDYVGARICDKLTGTFLADDIFCCIKTLTFIVSLVNQEGCQIEVQRMPFFSGVEEIKLRPVGVTLHILLWMSHALSPCSLYLSSKHTLAHSLPGGCSSEVNPGALLEGGWLVSGNSSVRKTDFVACLPLKEGFLKACVWLSMV